jgi:hypothetical protein
MRKTGGLMCMARISGGILDGVILVDKMLISAKPADLQIEQRKVRASARPQDRKVDRARKSADPAGARPSGDRIKLALRVIE